MSSDAIMTEQDPLELAVGRIVKPHGIHGELVLDVLTDSPELRFAAGVELAARWRGSNRTRRVTVASARPHAGRMLLRAEGVESRNAAEELRGAVLTARIAPGESADSPDEFHDHQLEGLRVEHTTGAHLGAVREMVHTPAGDLLAVRTPEDIEVLVPFVTDIVPEVDLAGGRLVVDPPEGMFDAE